MKFDFLLYAGVILCMILLSSCHCIEVKKPPPHLNSFTWKKVIHQTTTYDEWKSAGFSAPQMKGVFYRSIGPDELIDALVGEAQPCDYLKTKRVKLVDHLRVSANNGM